MQKLSEKEKENSLNEIRILASIKYEIIRHPNIVGYKEAFFEESSSSLCLIMEFASNGDLLQKINNHIKEKSFFTEKEVWRIFAQVQLLDGEWIK